MNIIVWGVVAAVVLAGAAALFVFNGNDETSKVSDESAGAGIRTTPDESAVPESAVGGQINLSGQDLSEVPKYVFAQTDAVLLDLSDNSLSGALPGEVRLLQNLRTLDISGNDFTGVPAEVGQLKNLEVLNISNNPITGLPYEIGNLQKLRVLDLRNTDYAEQDLEVIRKNLPKSTEILI